jgi:hypothetical protein
MKLQLLSDLHLERDPSFVPVAVPGADVLVLAGDVGSYQAGSRLGGDDFGLGRFSPRLPGSPWREVLYVPGNHEYDGLEFAPTHARLRSTCDALGITWLEQAVVVIGSVRFVGATLWADFDAFAQAEKTLAGQLKQRDKAFRAANFYLRKFSTLQRGKPMLAEAMREVSLASQAWVRNALATPFDGSTVVVTHFAPSLRSADPRYGLTPGTAGFCNHLDDLLPQAQLWLHGHLHCHHDYVVQGASQGRPFSCRVVANPLGYANKGEQQGFQADLLIEVPTAAQA